MKKWFQSWHRIPPVYHPYTTRIPPYTLYKGNTKVIYRILPYTSVYLRIPPIVAILKLITVYFRILPYTTVYHRIPPVYHPYTTRIPPVYHQYIPCIYSPCALQYITHGVSISVERKFRTYIWWGFQTVSLQGWVFGSHAAMLIKQKLTQRTYRHEIWFQWNVFHNSTLHIWTWNPDRSGIDFA